MLEEKRACPGIVAAWLSKASLRGLTTVTSRAVSLPCVQCGVG